ncbi:MAG TPA: tripartite tricarboxylate transporter permease [Bacillota bacterium]|nr:tripartite tricarboxylate transporter permease [Bacillota bacterium]HOA15383.1 tripartite tricarboxylate transporter permease [Bacillota bacterium]
MVLANLTEGLMRIMNPASFFAMTLGVVVGILAGAMPGISPSMGVALMVPFTFKMDASNALIFLVAIYIAANYGGSITAVTINTPGTPSAVVTAFDGYPLARQGKAGVGLGVSLVASTIGGLIGAVILIAFAEPLAKVALKFWPQEYFALAILGLSATASLGGSNWLKVLISTLFGLLLCTVGMDPILGVKRFNFNYVPLYDGFTFIPALIGLLAISEVLSEIEKFDFVTLNVQAALKSKWPSIKDYWALKWSIFRASLIGTIVGIFPGAGATIATFISYDVEKRLSRTPEKFGTGIPEGVAAAEASNSASVGGALVPLLTLGVPGSATAAVLIGALMIHDLQPGPELFTKHPDVVYNLFSSMFVANAIMLVIGLVGSRLWVNVTRVRKEILFPFIFSFALIGSYAVRSSMVDIGICIGFGILGWVLRKFKFPLPPMVLGMVLGTMAEVNLRRALILGGTWAVFQRPISVTLLILSALSFGVPIYSEWKKRKKARQAA